MIYWILAGILILISIASRFIAPEKRFAKGIARAQLITLLTLKDSGTQLRGIELYKQVLSFRPGYNSERISEVLKSTRERVGSRFKFRDVVVDLIAKEYFRRLGLKPVPKNSANIYTVAREVSYKMFPENL